MAPSHTVAETWLRLLVAKKAPSQLSEFRQEVEGKGFRNPDTGNEVKFVSLPKTEQAKIFAEWRRKRRGQEPRKEKERGLIEVDKEDARKRAKHIADTATRWKVRDPDERIGDRFTPAMGRGYVTMGTLEINDVRGRRFERPLRLALGKPAKDSRKLVTGGHVQSRPSRPDDPGMPMYVQVDINPDKTYRELAEGRDRLEDEIYWVLIHEMTHARDVLMTPRQREKHKTRHKVPEGTPDELRTEAQNREYYNKPTEVRAFKQQVADDVRRELGRMYEDEDEPDWIGMDADAVMDLMAKSETWEQVRHYLSGPNRRKFLETVASVVRKFKEDKGGKTAAASFGQWVSGRRFRNPATGNDVLFKSLPKPEQAKIRARWHEGVREEDDKRGRPGKVEEPLFHTTSHASLEEIAEKGLVPRSGGGTFQHGGYAEHSQGKVFLSDSPQAARSWQDKVFQQLEDRHGDEEEDLGKRVPVMLRVKQRGTERDPVGDKDVPGSRYTEKVVPPEDIEFWHPKKKRWESVSEWGDDTDPEHAMDERSEHGVSIDEDAFTPGGDDEAYDRDDESARSREKAQRDAELEKSRKKQEERGRKEMEERLKKYLEPEARRKHIERIKEKGVKSPIPGAGTKPGVFNSMWQNLLKVDEKGAPLPDYPLEGTAPKGTAPKAKDPGLRDTGKETWQGGTVYEADVTKDSFVHFTPRSRARQILESGKLLANPPYEKSGIEGVQAISLGYGEHVPATQTTHIKHEEDDPLVAVVFQTSSVPSDGYSEEVVWKGDVDLRGAEIVGADEARKKLKQTPQKITEDDMVTYGPPPKTATRVADTWLRKIAKATFEEWADGRRFRNPATGNMILFKSLKQPEQERIRAQWGNAQRFDESPSKKPKRSEIVQSEKWGAVTDARSKDDEERQAQLEENLGDLWDQSRALAKEQRGKYQYEREEYRQEGAAKLSRYIRDNTLPTDADALHVLATQDVGSKGLIARGITHLTTDQVAQLFGVRPDADDKPVVVDYEEGRWVQPSRGTPSSWTGEATVAQDFAKVTDDRSEPWDVIMVADSEEDDRGNFVTIDYDAVYSTTEESVKEEIYQKALEKIQDRERKAGKTKKDSVFLRVEEADDIRYPDEDELTDDELKEIEKAEEELEEFYWYAREDLTMEGGLVDPTVHSKEEERLAVGPVKISRVYLLPGGMGHVARIDALKSLNEDMIHGDIDSDEAKATRMAADKKPKSRKPKPKKKPRVERFNVPANDVFGGSEEKKASRVAEAWLLGLVPTSCSSSRRP